MIVLTANKSKLSLKEEIQANAKLSDYELWLKFDMPAIVWHMVNIIP